MRLRPARNEAERGETLLLVRSCLAAAFGWHRDQRGRQLFIQSKKIFDTLTVVLEGLRAIAEINGAVELCVSFDEDWRHGKRIIEVGQ